MKRPFPGDPLGIANGCSCDPELNERGAGRLEDDGIVFEADFHCPLHGYRATIQDGFAEDEYPAGRTLH